MGEFVEHSLEELLPAFEHVQNVELFTPKEVNGLVKNCRRYEYRLNKTEKVSEDFVSYAEYLVDVISLLKNRRARLNYFHKTKFIDRVLMKKVATLFKRCCMRFKSDINIWIRYFDVLDMYRLRTMQSKAYVQALQIHGKNTSLRINAAKWEFFSNASPDNARTILQYGIRSQPGEACLYSALFNIEIAFVDKIIKRQKFLGLLANGLKDMKKQKAIELFDSDEDGDHAFDVPIEDSVIQLQVVEVVVKNALKNVAVKDIGEMILEMWRLLPKYEDLPKEGVRRIMHLLESELLIIDSEYSEILNVAKAELSGMNLYDAFDQSIERTPTENMYRKYLQFCKEALKKGDIFAEMKSNSLIKEMTLKGWANASDIDYVSDIIDDGITCNSESEKIQLLQAALEANQKNCKLWVQFLRIKTGKNEAPLDKGDIELILKLLDDAFNQVPLNESFGLWEFAIDFAMKFAPAALDEIFARAIGVSSPRIASEVKILKLKYIAALLSEGKISCQQKIKYVMELIEHKPNEHEFYQSVVDMELDQPSPNHKLITDALDASVNEHATNSYLAWISYIHYALAYRPGKVAFLKTRALASLGDKVCSKFIEEWTKLCQEQSVSQNKVCSSSNSLPPLERGGAGDAVPTDSEPKKKRRRDEHQK